jgi:hypothetical protein
MELDQQLRRLANRARRGLDTGVDNEPIAAGPLPRPLPGGRFRKLDRIPSRTPRVVGAVAAFFGLALLAAVITAPRVDSNLSFDAPLQGAEPRALAIASGLLSREAVPGRWRVDAPLFSAPERLGATANFQMGLAESVGVYVDALAQAAPYDSDLAAARGMLAPPAEGEVAADASLNSRAAQEAGDSLHRYALRRAALGLPASSQKRATTLYLRHVAHDMAEVGASLSAAAAKPAWLGVDPEAAKTFLRAKGRIYADALILDAAGRDLAQAGFAEYAAEFEAATAPLRAGAAISPLFPLNAPEGAQFAPNHLSALGFQVLRAQRLADELADRLET